MGTRELLLLQPQSGRRRRSRIRGADHTSRPLSRHGDSVARWRKGDDHARHQRCRPRSHCWSCRAEVAWRFPSLTRSMPEMNEIDLAPFTSVLVGESDEEIVALEARLRAAQLAADVLTLDALI